MHAKILIFLKLCMISVKRFDYALQKKTLYGDKLCMQTLTHICEIEAAENKIYLYYLYYFLFIQCTWFVLKNVGVALIIWIHNQLMLQNTDLGPHFRSNFLQNS